MHNDVTNPSSAIIFCVRSFQVYDVKTQPSTYWASLVSHDSPSASVNRTHLHFQILQLRASQWFPKCAWSVGLNRLCAKRDHIGNLRTIGKRSINNMKVYWPALHTQFNVVSMCVDSIAILRCHHVQVLHKVIGKLHFLLLKKSELFY